MVYVKLEGIFFSTKCLFFIQQIVFDHRVTNHCCAGLVRNLITQTHPSSEGSSLLFPALFRDRMVETGEGLRENEGQTIKNSFALLCWWCANPCHRHPI